MAFLVILIIAEDHIVLNLSNTSLLNVEMEPKDQHFLWIFRFIEAAFLLVFMTDIVLNSICYGKLYFKWMTAGILAVLALNAVCVLVPMLGEPADYVYLRGIATIMRFVFLGLHVPKFREGQKALESSKIGAERRTSKEDMSEHSIKSAAENVLEKLALILARTDRADKAHQDLQYCINVIASGKMFDEASWSDEDDSDSASDVQIRDGERKLSNQDNLKSWYKQYS